MTREEAKQLLPVITAWAEGKDIEWRSCSVDYWHTTSGDLGFDAGVHNYRIKPTPKYRPWKAEEVPLGARLSHKESRVAQTIIISCGHEGIIGGFRGRIEARSYQVLLDAYYYSSDNGKTWLPCGVLGND